MSAAWPQTAASPGLIRPSCKMWSLNPGYAASRLSISFPSVSPGMSTSVAPSVYLRRL